MKRMMTAFFLLFAVACGPTIEINPNLPDGGGDGNNGGGGSHELGLCSATNKCPSGQFCFNGLCALGCTSNANCSADQYCDTDDLGPVYFCKNKTVPTCTADNQCAASQLCLHSFCSMKPPEVKPTCDVQKSGSADDGCDKYSVCNDPNPDNSTTQDAYCASFPPCPQSGVCPTGQFGAVCNDGYLSGKGRFCMEGMCKDNSNCPSNWNCVKPFSNAVLGFCSSGAPGMPCTSNAQCASGNCMAPPGFAGACM